MTNRRFPLDFDDLSPNRAIELLADNNLPGKISVAAIIAEIVQADIAALGFALSSAIPHFVSQLSNDAGYMTAGNVATAISNALTNVYTRSTLSFGTGLAYDPVTGILAANTGNAYTLPQASHAVLGGVKVDGTTITINTLTGQISAFAGVSLVGNGLPNMDGSAAIGSSSKAARADHVHPVDTSRAPLDSPSFLTKVILPLWTSAPGAAAGQVGFNTGSGRFEFGDGTSNHTFVRRDGDTMTGALVLSGSPTTTLGAATKGYVDNAIASIPPGGGGSGGGDYIFTQGTPSANWIIQHNLNRFPGVAITDSAGHEVEGDVTFISNNEVIVQFSAAFSGTAYCN